MAVAIEAVGLTKYYGETPGIIDLDLEVMSGEIFGFLGPNGAGKSTTIRTFLDLLHPSSGTVTILGYDSHEESVEIRQRTGYLPGDLSMYDDMTAREMLRYFSALRDVDTEARVEELAERLRLDLDVKIGSYSSGNRQKVGVVQAFMHDPELLILDEPSTGLDPLMQQEFYQMIDEARQAGRTVFLSSHILPEVERTADRIGIVRNSELITVQTVDDLKARARRHFQIVFGERVSPSEFSGLAGVQSAVSSHDGYGVDILIEGDLEDAFLAFYTEDDAA
jgi:ABC-2 type transport system ATP-binding protein